MQRKATQRNATQRNVMQHNKINTYYSEYYRR